MPDLRARPDRARIIYVAGLMNEIILISHFLSTSTLSAKHVMPSKFNVCRNREEVRKRENPGNDLGYGSDRSPSSYVNYTIQMSNQHSLTLVRGLLCSRLNGKSEQ
jgi:hypothetical protein